MSVLPDPDFDSLQWSTSRILSTLASEVLGRFSEQRLLREVPALRPGTHGLCRYAGLQRN